ncbi:G5 domain-containing protein [Nosocomiicoccus ampullae]|uniref:LPXTG-motif cell wall-anchored protein n=1 Tax=Nosocomiicoccus ampullae TaxID=489910 RepID=A0A9Q2CZI6_9STAP|nr:G5 domain-containing protein [Nosocomiicoccus ampullae]MBB5175921.1 LPXTG-motif cell wall-anchored protein [Nosocomiicoccus ampullae]QYA46744.1 G5 domain-containing protein [Nosocomiicoccus ampullae]
MNKHYRYTLRKTTLGLGSVAVAMFLAGQADTAKAAEEDPTIIETSVSPENTDDTVDPISPTQGDNLEDNNTTLPEENVSSEGVDETPEATQYDADEGDADDVEAASELAENPAIEENDTDIENRELDIDEKPRDVTNEVSEDASGNATEKSELANPAAIEENDTNAEGAKSEKSEEPQVVTFAAKAATNEPNYAKDEAKIKDYSKNERYRSTDLEQGNGTNFEFRDPSMDFKDGFRYKTIEPGDDSPDKKKWGIEIEFDKEKGQRTYTLFSFTNGGNLGSFLTKGTIPASDEGVKLIDDSKATNYKAESDIEINGSGIQRNLNLVSTKEDLAHINSLDNNNTVMSWKGNYTKDHTSGVKATQGPSAEFTLTVNPWPNENDMLSEIKLNGSHNKKEFVQGQTITTDVSVENLDDNARERLVGQVYHPVTGEVVPDAKAYIDENDKVVIEMPQGAVDENGNINKNSIFFKDSKYKGLQNLSVKFFARPRTQQEFEAVHTNTPENYGEGAYTQTGAGTETINHKGQDVVIDKQGIDRYDHYNLIGSFNINLDDTRYYDQGFIDGNNEDTSKHTSSAVKPGEEFTVELYVPEDKKDRDVFPNQKTPEEMEAAKDANQAVGSIDFSFINKINADKAKEDQWKLEFDENTLPTTLKIIPPASAKAGEFVAVPLVYTYTNGSTDTHWFHFVVQESTNNKPEYPVQVAFPSEEQKSLPELSDDDKKLKPVEYYIPEGTEFKDDRGNEWNVSIDKTTGEITAQPVDPTKFDGGEKLQVPVTTRYVDENEPDKNIEEKTRAEFVIKEKANMTPRYNAKAGKSGDVLTSDVILNEEDKFNRRPTKYSLASNTYTDDKGNAWNVSIDENTGTVTATVPEGENINGALLNVPVTAHYYEQGSDQEIATREVEVQFVAYGTNGKIEKDETVEIPFETIIEFDDSLAPGEKKVAQEGIPGEKTRTNTLTIEDSKVTNIDPGDFEITKEPTDRIIKVGRNTEGKVVHEEKIPFDYDIEYDENLEAGQYVIDVKGTEGTKTITWTIKNSEIVGEPEVEFKAPVKAKIRVGQKDFTGTFETKKTEAIEFETEYIVDNELEPGTVKVERAGELGETETPVTHTIVNGEVTESKEGKTKETKAPVKRIVKVGPAKTDGTHTYTSKTPFEVEVRVNPELKKGEYKVVQKGVEGEEEYTITIENSKVTNTSDPKQTKAPVNEIIEVGNTDFTGSVEYVDKDPIPFETEVTVDPSLKPGEVVEDQKGELGEQETKVTRTITNGEAGEEVRGETTRTKEPVNRKIRVGSKTDGQYKETETIPFEVEVRKDPTLKKGEWKYAEVDGVQQTGESGLKERTLTIVNSKVTEETEYKTTREPKNAVILVGDLDSEGKVEHTEELPFDYKVEEVDDLKKGEYRIVKPGKVGTKTTTWTIKDSKVVEGPTVTEEVPAEDALIQIGKGTTDGTHEIVEKKEIPFETIIEYDDSLAPGEEKVVQEGKPGIEERTNTLVIKDGKVVETKEGKFERTENPVNKIVKVGRKSTEGETTHTIEREIPFETKVIYDDTLEAGFQQIENEGKPGKEEVTVTQKVKDGQPVGEPTETVNTITEKEDRVVRVGVKPVVKEIELGHDIEYRHNPELKEGETRVIVEGTKGSVKYTTTFNKETGELEITEERVEPTNKVVEYGSKTEGEITFESERAYNVIVRENPELEAGKTNVIQEGVVGKTETTVKIENSQEVSRDTRTIVEKQDKIIEVGTKNVCEIPPTPEQPNPDPEEPKPNPDPEPTPEDPENPENPEQPGEEDPKDPEAPGGEDPKDPEAPGGEDPKDPEAPGEEDPKNPETPGEEEPKDPEAPDEEEPKDPEAPDEEEPKDPEKPGEEDPKDPEAPGETPQEPGKPKEPEVPEQPEQPGEEDPKDPEAPGKPDETPQEPGKPGTPGKPEQPNVPAQPNKPDQSNKVTASKDKEDDKKLPNTGEAERDLTLFATALATLGGAFTFGRRRNRKED